MYQFIFAEIHNENNLFNRSQLLLVHLSITILNAQPNRQLRGGYFRNFLLRTVRKYRIPQKKDLTLYLKALWHSVIRIQRLKFRL